LAIFTRYVIEIRPHYSMYQNFILFIAE